MKRSIVCSITTAALLLGAADAVAVESLIEGFENTADPGGWRQVSPAPGQIRNATNSGSPVPTYVTTHATEGVNAGQFDINWISPGTDPGTANALIPGGTTFYWAMRCDLGSAAGLPNSTIPNSSAVLKADIFNNGPNAVQVAFYVADNAGSGGLERGPFQNIPAGATTTYQWTMGVDPVVAFVTGDSVLNGTNSLLRGFFVYTETDPATTLQQLDVDNIRIDAQSDLTAPAVPTILSVKQGTNPGDLDVAWSAVADGDLAGYYVYLAQDTDFGSTITNRFTFPSTPAATVGPTVTSTTLTGLSPDTNYYVRVTAFDNATPVSNESLSDIALGARLLTSGAAPDVQVVLDYDRYPPTDGNFAIFAYFHGIVYWGQSLAALGKHYVTCRAAAVESGSVVLDTTSGSVTIWSTNRDGEATADQTLTEANQTKINDFLTGGGDLLIAGTSLGEDLSTNGSVADQTFYSNVLKATLTNENSAVGTFDLDVTNFPTVTALATSGEVFNSAGGSNTDNEVVTAGGGATGALAYTGVTPGNAAILNGNALVYLAFAFETVRDTTTTTTFGPAVTARTNLLTDALNYLAVEPPPPAADATGWTKYE